MPVVCVLVGLDEGQEIGGRRCGGWSSGWRRGWRSSRRRLSGWCFSRWCFRGRRLGGWRLGRQGTSLWRRLRGRRLQRRCRDAAGDKRQDGHDSGKVHPTGSYCASSFISSVPRQPHGSADCPSSSLLSAWLQHSTRDERDVGRLEVAATTAKSPCGDSCVIGSAWCYAGTRIPGLRRQASRGLPRFGTALVGVVSPPINTGVAWVLVALAIVTAVAGGCEASQSGRCPRSVRSFSWSGLPSSFWRRRRFSYRLAGPASSGRMRCPTGWSFLPGLTWPFWRLPCCSA